MLCSMPKSQLDTRAIPTRKYVLRLEDTKEQRVVGEIPKRWTAWWFQTFGLCSLINIWIYGMSSFPLTKSIIFKMGTLHHQPVKLIDMMSKPNDDPWRSWWIDSHRIGWWEDWNRKALTMVSGSDFPWLRKWICGKDATLNPNGPIQGAHLTGVDE